MLPFLLFLSIVLRLTWLWKPGFASLMISSANSLVLFKLQHSLRRDRLLNKDLTMNSKFEAN